MSDEKIFRKKTLYTRLLIPAVVLAIIGCVYLSVSTKSITQSTVKDMDVEELDTYVPLVFKILEDEKRSLQLDVEYAKKTITDFKVEDKITVSLLNDFVKQYGLYGAILTDTNGKIISVAGNASKELSQAEKKTVLNAVDANPACITAVKGEEILFTSAIKIGKRVLVFEKNLTSISQMETWAEMLGCVMTYFIDDLRVETTIKDDKGNYLKGTKLNNDKIYNIVYKDGEIYRGNNIINNKPYVTVYVPLRNEDNINTLLFMGISIESIENMSDQISKKVSLLVVVSMIILIAVIIVLVGILIMKQLNDTVKAFGELNGNSGISDLTQRIKVKRKDEIGLMGIEINKFIESQQNLLGQVKSASLNLEEIGQNLASSSQESASAISEIMANITNVKKSVEQQMKNIKALGNEATAKDKNFMIVLELCQEMYKRGYSCEKVSLMESQADTFRVIDDRLIPPFAALQGLGQSVAQAIVQAREEGPFTSVEDLANRAKLGSAILDTLRNHGVLEGMPESDQLQLF